jgi:hypothetical protein
MDKDLALLSKRLAQGLNQSKDNKYKEVKIQKTVTDLALTTLVRIGAIF